MNEVQTDHSDVVLRGVGKEERGKGVVASSLHVYQGSRWLHFTNNICEEETEASSMTVSPRLTAADTDGPQAAPFIRQ